MEDNRWPIFGRVVSLHVVLAFHWAERHHPSKPGSYHTRYNLIIVL